MAELTVLEVEASEIVNTQIKGHVGGTSVVVLVQCNLSYGIDLDAARYRRVDQDERHLVLAMPQPAVRRVAIDPQTSQMLSCERTGLWQVAVGPAREDQAFTAALAIGHDRLKQAGSQDNLVDRARHHAEVVLSRFVLDLGWTLDVRWVE